MFNRSQLKEVFAKYGFRPLRRLGENYLIDSNIKDKIVSLASPSGSDTILEIGPGLGAITFDLAASGSRVYAVEKDRKAFYALKEIAGDKYPGLTLIHDDILKFDIRLLRPPAKLRVVGNLPYYITTPIIEKLIENAALIDSALIMVQREVADRLMSGPGSREYSSLSCFVQYHTRAEYLHTVKRTSFFPVPEVDSSLIRLNMLEEPAVRVKDEELFFRIIRGAFNQRRKTLINSLSRELALDIPKKELSVILEEADVSPSARPESLSLADFARIAGAVTR